MQISGASAVITGGASGLGAAVATELASAGARVALFDLNREKGEALAKELGGIFIECDVSSEQAAVDAFAKVKETHGAARILMNCAGIGPAAKTTSKGKPHPFDLFQKVININLIGSFNCIRLAATDLAELDPVNEDGERGVFISTASVAAYDGQIGQAAYSASKGGIVGMTLPIARDLSSLGIRVCTIAPGIFLTPLLESLPQNVQDSLAATIPFPSRLGKASEFAAMARHIVENSMLNGETIRLDGAIRMAPR
jgi:NAD(P)-dependent dehydrogenase (short-subunit alcohol dehydrogenase family)